MSVADALQCISLSLILASHHINNINIPLDVNITINISNNSIFPLKLPLELDNIVCPELTMGTMGVDYNISGLHVYAMDNTILNCHVTGRASLPLAGWVPVGLSVELEIEKNKYFYIKTIADDPQRPCFVTNASVEIDEFNISVNNLTIDIGNWSSIPLGPSTESVMAELLFTIIKDFLEVVAASVWSNNFIPLSPYPEYVHGCQRVSEWPLARLLKTIAGNLPTIEGIRLAASYPADTALQVNVSLPPLSLSNNNSNNNNNNYYYNEINKKIIEEFGIFSFSVPDGIKLSVDVGFKMLVCRSTPFQCTALHGIELINLRAYGDENYYLFNSFISPLITSSLTSLIMNNSTDKPFDVNLTTDRSIADPPQWVIILTGPLLAICAVAAVAFSAHRHTVTPVLDAFGRSITVTRVIIEDCFIVSVCFGCIYLFIWSNTTTAATVVIGDEIEVYSFSLINTIEDLWSAGLYPLSFFVCLFSGVYPYIKLITIVVYSVLLQRPQSRILRIVDNLGKFSLLDTFVMTILKTGLELQGIAAVNSQPSFYIFMVATVLSIAIGNYATHGWRRETSVRRKSETEGGEMTTASLITYNNRSESNNTFNNNNNNKYNNNTTPTTTSVMTTPNSIGGHWVYVTKKKPDSIPAEIDVGDINNNNNIINNNDSSSKKKKKMTTTTTSSGGSSSSNSKRQNRNNNINNDENSNNNNDNYNKCATPSSYSNPDGTTPGTPTTPIDIGILDNNNINNNNITEVGYGANGVRTADNIDSSSTAAVSGGEGTSLLVKNNNNTNNNNINNNSNSSCTNKNSNRFIPVVLLKEGENNNKNKNNHIVALADNGININNINSNNTPTADENNTNTNTTETTPITLTTLTNSSDEDSRRIYITKKKWYQVWEWRVAVPCSIIVFICTLLPCLYNCLQYNISGIAILVMGTKRVFSMWSLFTACESYFLVIVGIFTTLVAPVLYIFTYPHGRFLSAWCATDAFLLACVAGLLQLKQFIEFVLGPGMAPVYSAGCEMLWPLLPLLLSMAVQWLFIARQSCNIRGVCGSNNNKNNNNNNNKQRDNGRGCGWCIRAVHQWYTLRSSTV